MNRNLENSSEQILRAASRIIIALLMGFFVLGVSTSAAFAISRKYPALIQSLPLGQGFVIQSALLVTSVLLILALGKGALSNYGFRLSKDLRFSQIIIIGLIVGIVSSLAESIVPGEIPNDFADTSFIDIVIGVWILASIAEELLTRGLIQGFLAPLIKFGFSFKGFRISIPVLISSLFFGLMHLGLLSAGADFSPVAMTVIFAFILGIIAGYYRERSGSLIPAVVIHICGNIGAWLPGAIFQL